MQPDEQACSPIAHLVGQTNQAPVIVIGQRVTTLIDLGHRFPVLALKFCECMTLKVHPLGRLLELEDTGGSAIPYQGCIEVNLQIPCINEYNGDILLLVILTMTYSEKVQVMVRSKIINRAMGNDDKGGTHEGNHDLETGSLWCSYVWVTSAALHRPKGKWRRRSLPSSDPTASRGFCPG